MPTALIWAGLILSFWGSIAAISINENGPWAAIILVGTGLISFFSGLILYIIERR